MSMYSRGAAIKGSLAYASGALSPSLRYELRLTADRSITPEQAELIASEIQKRFGVEVTYLTLKDRNLLIQFKLGNVQTYQLLTAAVIIANLPVILSIAGLVLAGAGLFYIIGTTPSWVYIVIGLGIILLFFGGNIVSFIGRQKPAKPVQPVQPTVQPAQLTIVR
jgi:hypothetical protein